MSKKLKQFIGENRHSFDDAPPPESVWDRINTSVPALQTGKRSPLKKIYRWSAAAAVFLAAAACFYLFAWKGNKDDQETARRNGSYSAKESVQGINDPEYAIRAGRIYQVIEKKQEELKTLSADQPELYDQFTQDLATLDSSYRVLKEQAKKSPNREILIKAMMNNLQLQAELLSKQLSIISEYNSPKQEKDSHEKDNYRRL
ncbi:MAG: hypothetical protein J0I32_16085 [Sphingobacteriales bacterium]|nr:hypothetical protein [Sphingobacteriales bacterium]OJV99665.1 MAG: hypothetical protein BGO52_13605 [Sphingobacteriales bacterium 44-61]